MLPMPMPAITIRSLATAVLAQAAAVITDGAATAAVVALSVKIPTRGPVGVAHQMLSPGKTLR